MKKTMSLRTQMSVFMALLVVVQSCALLLALMVSRVFYTLDAESFRVFDNTTVARAQKFNSSVASLVGSMADETNALTSQLNMLAKEHDANIHRLYANDALYETVAMTGAEVLVDLLHNTDITGAFFMLGGSNANPNNPSAHSGVYIRNSVPDAAKGSLNHYQLEIGPSLVSQQYKIPMAINWNLDMMLDEVPPDLYLKPIQAASEFPKSEVQRYGYWSSPVAILADNQPVVMYTMPLTDAKGIAYGVVGIEISLQYFTKHYLPNVDLPYHNSFFSIASNQDDALDFSWYIPSGPLAEAYLKQLDELPMQPVGGDNMYQAQLENLGDVYCSVQKLDMYSENSPYYDTAWSLVGFVPKQELHQTSTGVRRILVGSILLTIAGSFTAIFLISYLSTRKISGLSNYLHSLSPYNKIEFEPTGLREVDELTAAVKKLNTRVMNASKTTSKILELSLMPLGGFEYSTDSNEVVVTEYIYQLLGLEPGTVISQEQWVGIYQDLTAFPASGYENVYLFLRGNEAQQQPQQPLWLRIHRAVSSNGYVGIVLDVTKDIEERRRMAHELDYDSLTHLYNRVSFKREAHALIKSQPNSIGAMMFSDLDNLKYINDTFGHDVGDQLLVSAGDMFGRFSRYGGVVARISGDEFAVYMHGFSSKEEARKIIYKQYAANAHHTLKVPSGDLQRIRCSTGIAWYPEDSDNVNDLLKLSDFAMYEAKNNRKGSVFEFNTDSYREKAYLLENREAINRLLDEDRIRFALQPIVSLRTGRIFAYEALMRSTLPNFRSPMEILAVAQAQSKLAQLERVVMLGALKFVYEHQQELGDHKVFINSIPSQIMTEEDHRFIVQQYSGIFDRVIVEITETESDILPLLEAKLDFLRKNNIQVAIDDFGSGHSNEIRVLSVEPDLIKVDMVLIQGISRDVDKQKLVRNLLEFCHSKGIEVVAEGVETADDLAKIMEMGVDYVQGYYVGRPSFDIKPINEVAQKKIAEILGYRRYHQERI